MMKIYATAMLFYALFLSGQKPITTFTISEGAIAFTEASSEGPQIYSWEFPNGSISTSSDTVSGFNFLKNNKNTL